MLEKLAVARPNNEELKLLHGERGDQQIHAGTVVGREMYVSFGVTEESKSADIVKGFSQGDLVKGIEKIIDNGLKFISFYS